MHNLDDFLPEDYLKIMEFDSLKVPPGLHLEEQVSFPPESGKENFSSFERGRPVNSAPAGPELTRKEILEEQKTLETVEEESEHEEEEDKEEEEETPETGDAAETEETDMVLRSGKRVTFS